RQERLAKLFTEAVRRWDVSFTENLPDYMKELVSFFRKGWEDYLLGYYEEAEWLAAEYVPSLDEYIK
uniref:Alpha-bisabolene synthase (Fragments) n=1 Tax=Pseudotsuga menziesii TaxID=3357 RepID=TPSD1_PSEMZ|nr:RecName: Full=Alpha-bisabolene synthase; AltName: Full=(E)-alpha-bisabolene synthase [Pseudotsuga menziesii]